MSGDGPLQRREPDVLIHFYVFLGIVGALQALEAIDVIPSSALQVPAGWPRVVSPALFYSALFLSSIIAAIDCGVASVGFLAFLRKMTALLIGSTASLIGFLDFGGAFPDGMQIPCMHIVFSLALALAGSTLIYAGARGLPAALRHPE